MSVNKKFLVLAAGLIIGIASFVVVTEILKPTLESSEGVKALLNLQKQASYFICWSEMPLSQARLDFSGGSYDEQIKPFTDTSGKDPVEIELTPKGGVNTQTFRIVLPVDPGLRQGQNLNLDGASGILFDGSSAGTRISTKANAKISEMSSDIRTLAEEILNNPNITVDTEGTCDDTQYNRDECKTRTSPYAVLEDIKNSKYPCVCSKGCGCKVGGYLGETTLSPLLLQTMLEMAAEYKFKIESLTGGQHSPNSYHYMGMSADLVPPPNTDEIATFYREIMTYLKDKNRKQLYGPITICQKLGLSPCLADHENHIHYTINEMPAEQSAFSKENIFFIGDYLVENGMSQTSATSIENEISSLASPRPSGQKIEYIVLHDTYGTKYFGNIQGSAADLLLDYSKTDRSSISFDYAYTHSVNYVIDQEGSVILVIPEDQMVKMEACSYLPDCENTDDEGSIICCHDKGRINNMNTIGIEIVSTGGVGGITLRQQTTVKNLVNYLIAEYGLDPETSIISHSCIVSEPLASVYEPLGFQAVSTWGWNIKKSGNKNCPYQTSAEVPQTPTDQQKPEFVVPYECVLNDGIKQYSYTRNPQNIKYIVLHSLENSNYQQAIIYLANNQMSAHYLIDREGTTYLCIPPDTYSAWHAGCISDDPSCLIPEIDQSSIGVVLLKGDGYTTKQKDSLNNLINSLVSKYGIDPNSNIIGHGCVSSADYVAIDEPVSFEPASESGWKLMKRNTGGCPK